MDALLNKQPPDGKPRFNDETRVFQLSATLARTLPKEVMTSGAPEGTQNPITEGNNGKT